MGEGKFLFLPFGIWVFVLGILNIYFLYTVLRVYFFKKTSGVITKSRLKKEVSSSYESYYPCVEYVYTVKGKKLKSNRVFISDIKSDYKTASSIVEEFPEGRKVTVYFNPLNPSESVLKRGYHSGLFIQTLVFLGMFSVFIFTLFFEIIYYGSDLTQISQQIKYLLHKIIYGESND